MPAQVQRRQSEPIPVTQKSMQQHQALKLALGSILTPKRPPVHPNSRPSSGTASPAFHGTYSSSGAHTPIGSPPSGGFVVSSSSGTHYPPPHGLNSSEHLHPYYSYGYTPHGHGHGHVPSRLGPGRSPSGSNSPSESPANSNHPSPSRNADAIVVSISSSDIEPLTMPPPVLGIHTNGQHTHQDQYHAGTDPPPPTPSTPQPFTGYISQQSSSPPTTNLNHVAQAPLRASDGLYTPEHATHPGLNGEHASGRITPRAKFLQTLQGKSAWDALIHGSFS